MVARSTLNARIPIPKVSLGLTPQVRFASLPFTVFWGNMKATNSKQQRKLVQLYRQKPWDSNPQRDEKSAVFDGLTLFTTPRQRGHLTRPTFYPHFTTYFNQLQPAVNASPLHPHSSLRG